eukprot:CAMPEP_0183337022 /NCGR_PEP_ID=MMETSP0164_2-20130417/4831_1 /TAXON_ID=221442 /ORGANISM="Coccolithus pelagicus ssp braarudi, Strain PLY182g" /LENGTH=86 /DNA_ID=CAMNT_0025506661 /DNA_START=63 /DNA_END=319 /DNA_ORIENTATION=+
MSRKFRALQPAACSDIPAAMQRLHGVPERARLRSRAAGTPSSLKRSQYHSPPLPARHGDSSASNFAHHGQTRLARSARAPRNVPSP